jgi:serpin B
MKSDMRNWTLAILALAAALWLGGPAAASVRTSVATPRPILAQTTGAFGLDLLRRFPEGNVVVSPDSVESALAMLGEGARGKTAAQIAHVVHLAPPASFAAIGALQAALAREARIAAGTDPHAPRLAIANGLFVQEGFVVEPPYLAALQHGFGAAPVPLDFARQSGAATQAINEWVSTHTEGEILKILEGLGPEAKLVLANAVYLEARWATRFARSAVAPASFFATTGAEQVPFMHAFETVPFAAGPGYRAVELPYHASDLSLMLVLPSRQGLSRLQSHLSGAGLTAIAKRLRPHFVELSLPKFHIGFKQDLRSTLEGLGMRLAFGPAANLSGISACDCLEVEKVIHDADIRVEEDGTIAAAATVIELTAVSGISGPTPVAFDADRPFLFFLRDDRTGTVLFAGRLADALAAQS